MVARTERPTSYYVEGYAPGVIPADATPLASIAEPDEFDFDDRARAERFALELAASGYATVRVYERKLVHDDPHRGWQWFGEPLFTCSDVESRERAIAMRAGQRRAARSGRD